MEGKWLPNFLMKWDMFVFAQCILAPVQRKKCNHRFPSEGDLTTTTKKSKTINCSTKMPLSLIKAFHLQSQADSQTTVSSYPTPTLKNGQCLDFSRNSRETAFWDHSCVYWNGGMSDIFFPEQEWEAVVGWWCFSLTNGTVTQRSYSVSCVF